MLSTTMHTIHTYVSYAELIRYGGDVDTVSLEPTIWKGLFLHAIIGLIVSYLLDSTSQTYTVVRPAL